jgi:hypothetical protein
MVPLVAQRLADNVAALCHGIANVLARRWDVVRKLDCNASDERAGMPNVAVAAREEEAGAETPMRVVVASHRSRDCRFACARQAAKPKDVSLVSSVSPAMDLAQEIDARAGEASEVVLLCKCVEGRIWRIMQEC